MKAISLWNEKGGVGKTTLAFNIGANLASKGKSVLLIDLDPQANLTSFFDVERKKNPGKLNICEAVKEDRDSISPSIYHSKRFPNLHYVLGTNHRVNFKSNTQLYEMLSDCNEDYCIIDCHPDSSISSINAIVASDLILVPITLDGFSRDNLNLVIDEIDQLGDETSRCIPYRVVINMFKNRRTQKAVYEDLLQNHDYDFLKNIVRDSSAVTSATLAHKSLALHRKKNKATEDLFDLTDEIVNVLESF